MVLTKRVNYGIRGLMNLERNSRQSFLKKVSEEEQIPESYLAKIFQVFVQRGILDSKKGPNGGFYLARKLDDISVGKIVECLEGEPNLDSCPFSESFSCERKDSCLLYDTWRRTEQERFEALKTITIQHIYDTCCSNHAR
jgi:Rrf2 family iron-sulfur cluster assembly transcriptional regulator